ncbi:ARM repeat superfamily protein [Actinidia rufa]|uniref:Protein SDA1 n=1 Tax=Actinidia rufa TaxID=165716 RepID=A0A7J0FMS8_9ERIC|nr:ARM repeat superfamily protein [Actinidia rufa]
MMMLEVIARTVGLHRLILLNFYPFLQKYVQPHQCDITNLLAAAAQACHDMAIAVGVNVVREICVPMPLDIGEVNVGRSTDSKARPKAFGEVNVASNVPGLELLQDDEEEAGCSGDGQDSVEYGVTSSDDQDGDVIKEVDNNDDGGGGGSDGDEEEEDDDANLEIENLNDKMQEDDEVSEDEANGNGTENDSDMSDEDDLDADDDDDEEREDVDEHDGIQWFAQSL